MPQWLIHLRHYIIDSNFGTKYSELKSLQNPKCFEDNGLRCLGSAIFCGAIFTPDQPRRGAFFGIARKLFDDKELGLAADFTDKKSLSAQRHRDA